MLKYFWLFFLMPLSLFAQFETPARWSTSVKELPNNEFEIIVSGKIDDGWHIYSIKHPDGGIGIPATFTVTPSTNVKLVGKSKEVGKLIEKYSQIFEQDEKYYEKNVRFIQKVKVTDEKPVDVAYMLEFQMCDAEKCLPPDEYTGKVKLSPKAVVADTAVEEQATTAESSAILASSTDSIVSTSQEADQALVDTTEVTTKTLLKEDIDESLLAENEKKNNGLLRIFVLGFLGGLAAFFMPCIFPMIPLTVSLFTKQSKTRGEGIRKAMVYGLSIIAIYVLLGLVVTWLLGPSALNEMSTNPWVNLAFFVVFLIFALSFFGAFEITLPSKWVNFADKGADKGGMIGIFFMAFTLALVSFSCTGPIIGSLLVQATQESNYFALIVGMLGFSLALAIPFTLFAMFPGWLNSMPKSGGWLNTIKVSLGFLELALALKFLSNADLVWQLHWLEREVFIAAWLGIFILLGAYLLGMFKLELDGPDQKIGVTRLMFATLTFSFVFYILPGMWGAPLKILSGLLPPMHYAESPNGLAGETTVSSETVAKYENPKMVAGPHGIPLFKDFEDAKAYSLKVKKPIFIDFTGHACANCRKVEDRVWIDPRVKKILTEDVVVASLYVDERQELPEEEKVYSEALKRNLRTIGNKWTAFEMEHFNANAQPYYIIVDENLKRYSKPMQAEYDIDVYLKWLQGGIDKYNESHP
ncbi:MULTISPECIES: cytochrome c biogenesis protein CcdA [Weeksella]|uniref:protein-disulfide reductase DsbD family protein n=1 Tax=Weeksella TaxID=1013 RepID=UPI0008A35460|nr:MULTISPECIES: cytochrome c biogenesis protein CcdA [Weeksella]MDK7374533.1 cytochrome c biogenesis protein CcdA [Weeksella virosa]OFM83144.1 protein-disulfide reductase [Weeksella sp. HMSC059D05]